MFRKRSLNVVVVVVVIEDFMVTTGVLHWFCVFIVRERILFLCTLFALGGLGTGKRVKNKECKEQNMFYIHTSLVPLLLVIIIIMDCFLLFFLVKKNVL